METYDKIQGAIQELLQIQAPYEEFINSSRRIKEIEILITTVISYADGLSILMKNQKYDSVLPIGRSFIEIYPSIIYMIEKFSDTNEFDKYFNKLIVDDMVQDLATYKSMKSDMTIPESDEKNTELATYITRWENMVDKYFVDKKSEIIETAKDDSLIQIIKDLDRYYKSEYHGLCNSKNDFIGDAIRKNQEIIAETGKEYEASYVIYRLLCSETHGNVGSLDTRVVSEGRFTINKKSQNNAEAMSDLVFWSLKDISARFKALLETEE